MTANSKMQHSSQPMFPTDTGAGPPQTGNHVETARSLDPRHSLGDYNRTMLEYTQRQMTSFVDLEDNNGGGGASSRSSQSSGNSGRSDASINGVLVGQANGPPPTSASSAAQAQHEAQRTRFKGAHSPNEAKPSRY